LPIDELILIITKQQLASQSTSTCPRVVKAKVSFGALTTISNIYLLRIATILGSYKLQM
jgi:hypothetical protein